MTEQLEATITADQLLIRVETPAFTNVDEVVVELDAQVEREKQIVRRFNIADGARLRLDDEQGSLDAAYRGGKLVFTTSRQGHYSLTDQVARNEGAQGNVSLEIKNADSHRDLILLTIVAIGPAPRTTTTQIRVASQTLILPTDFVQKV